MKQSKYFIKESGKLTLCNNIETYGYFLSGYNNPAECGQLTTLKNIDGATCLVPVYDSKGMKIFDRSKAGKYYNEN